MFITFLICALLSVAPLHNQYNVEEHTENNVVEKLERKNMTMNGNTYYLGIGDIQSVEYFYNLMQVINSNESLVSGFDYLPYSVARNSLSDKTLTFDHVPNGYSTSWAYGYMSSSNGGYVIGQNTRFDKFTILRHWSSDYCLEYTLSFYYLNTEISDLHIYYRVIYYNGSNSINVFIPQSSLNAVTAVISDVAIEGNYDIFYKAFMLDTSYETGYSFGFADGELVAQTSAYDNGYSAGVEYGRQEGYAEGLQDGQEQTGVVTTIFNGIISVGMLPVNVFLQMFNYEIFGINISGLVSGLLTVAMTIIIVRIVLGNKND